MSALPQTPDEAMEHYDRAMSIEVEDSDPSALTERASELALAIQKANGVFPAAHAMLGVVMAQLGNAQRARQELNLAIQQENCNTLARAFLILMDMDSLGVQKTVRTRSWLDLLFVGGEVAAVKVKIHNLSRAIDELVATYPQDISESSNIVYWINMSDLVLDVHDAMQDIKGLSGKDRLAQAVLNTPWDRIEIPQEHEQEVSDLKRRAEGRVALSQ